jgi:hypothetical protein
VSCGHPLCELIGGACSIAVQRSRGCRPNVVPDLAPDLFDEVRALLAAIDAETHDETGRTAAVRLATIIRREALDGRSLLALVRVEEPELAPALERLCVRR